MTNPVFNPDDPRLTAFVLGEIDDTDRAEIEQLLETSPEAQAAVADIEDTIGALREGLASEPAPELTADQRAAVEYQLAGRTMKAVTEAASLRRGGRFSKLAGVVASVSALGLLVTFVLPSFQPAREYSTEASRSSDEAQSHLMVMDDVEWTEETLSVAAATERADSNVSGGSLAASLDKAVRGTVANPGDNSFRGGYRVSAEIAELSSSGSSSTRQPEYSGPAGNTSGASLSAENDKQAGDVSKLNRAQVAQTSPAEKLSDFGRVGNQPKDASQPERTQRMTASSGSRPEPGGSLGGAISDGDEARPFRLAGRPAAASATELGSASKSDGAKPFYQTPPSSTPQSAGESAPDNFGLAKQPASVSGGMQITGPRPASVLPVKPESERESGLSNQLSTELASSAPVLPANSGPKKRVLFLEDEKRGVQQADTNKPVTESESLRQVRDREEALAREGKSQSLKEQSDGLETQLAAIDSGARRVGQRGLGMPGRDLQEQLQLYSESLIRSRSTLESKPEAKQPGSGFGTETYDTIVENDFIVPVLGDKEKSLSTISIDVDTASYANMRRFLNRDQLPPANSVRIEELVNYFKYDYPEPEGNEPFSVKTELASCPWQPSHRLAMVGLKAKTIDKAQRPPTNLVFLLDVSGSMRSSNKLPLVQQSMRLLVEEMTEDDRVAIVTYASNSGVRLESTAGSKKSEILAVIDSLQAGGSTNGEGGIRMAYDQANRHYFQGGANRVILCSDGDFNVGVSTDNELVELIQEKAASGVFLSVFGFGMGNLKDAKLEKLADKGNGHYGYIDNLNEAKKVFQDELVGTLYTVAKDVKLQVEFNPATVGAYRLIGYENRKLAAQDFTDDTKDAGEIGSGHTVTALYEIIPKQVLLEQPRVDGLKYQATEKNPAPQDSPADPVAEPVDPLETETTSEELLTVKLRFKKPDEDVSQPVEREFPVRDVEIAGKQVSAISNDLMFAASVASFGMNLRGSKYRGNWGFAEALETAQGAQGEIDRDQRAEFVQLVQRAMRITGQQVGPEPPASQGPTTRPGELDATAARIKASVDGKYRRLVKKIEVRDDYQRFGAFNDYGHWDGTEYAGHKDLLPGHWVYVYPNWYIWAEVAVPPEVKPAAEPAKPSVR